MKYSVMLYLDLANPKTNTRNAGFTQEERDGMTTLLEEGFVDF
jgi:exonuclease III